MAGIKNLEEVYVVFGQLLNAFAAIRKSGDYLDGLPHLVNAISALPAAAVGIGEVKDEALDMDEAERDQLIAKLNAVFAPEDLDFEAVIEDLNELILRNFLFINQYLIKDDELR